MLKMLAMKGLNFENKIDIFGKTTWNIHCDEQFWLLLFDLFIPNSWKSANFANKPDLNHFDCNWISPNTVPPSQPQSFHHCILPRFYTHCFTFFSVLYITSSTVFFSFQSCKSVCVLSSFESGITQHTHQFFKDISITMFKEVLEDVCQQQTARIFREGLNICIIDIAIYTL